MSKVHLTPNALEVFTKRYLLKDEAGNPVETVEECFSRVARAVAAKEEESYRALYEDNFESLMTSLDFLPNSPTFFGAGTPLGNLAACYVLGIDDDMGKEEQGIFQTLRNAALIQQSGGGNGFSFSNLRPKGALVKSSMGKASGPVSFMKIYDTAFNAIQQGGARRSANMAVLDVSHPDIEEFIECKSSEDHLTNFNISVAISDAFMEAVLNDDDWELVFDGEVWEVVSARKLFHKIVEHAHRNGEPGVLFPDAANRDHANPHLGTLKNTNPCCVKGTRVSTPSGWLPVEEIEEGQIVNTVLGSGPIATVERHENMPVYKVVLSDGEEVRVTAAHQFHARNPRTKFYSKIRTDELRPGMLVRVQPCSIPNNSVPESKTRLEDRDYGFLIGLLIGDGCYTPYAITRGVKIATNSAEPEWNAVIKQKLMLLGLTGVSEYLNKGSLSLSLYPTPASLMIDWVNSTLLVPAKSHEKEIPEKYINSNYEFLSGLLDGLISTDGNVNMSSNHPAIRYDTSSKKLAQQIRRILLMFGVHGRITESKRKDHSIKGRVIRNDRNKYTINISGTSFAMFHKHIHLSHPEKQSRMEEAILTCGLTGGNWAATIKEITPDGYDTVYDLYEPKSDTWITEGYVSVGCGEQWLLPFENCCLGSINLANHVENGEIDWSHLRNTICTSVRFLDNVIDVNKYVPSVPQLRASAQLTRRIGLGIMGLADLFYKLGVRYGSPDSVLLAEKVMEFIHFHALKASAVLAIERGSYRAIRGSVFDPENFTWEPPDYSEDPHPSVDWKFLSSYIQKYGIRNSAVTTVAPTGTLSTVASLEGYGCEPVFALAYTRYFMDGDDRKPLTYVSPLFEKALDNCLQMFEGFDKESVLKEVLLTGSCQGISELPSTIKETFVVSSDIDPLEHVRMQAALQRYCSNAISKTCNFPATATLEAVETAYLDAWNLGCKGLTVYVAGSRDKVVLETQQTKEVRVVQAEDVVVVRSSSPYVEEFLAPVSGDKDLCPSCEVNTLRKAEGCSICSCGFSACTV